MNEYLKAKIAADVNQDLLQFLGEDNLKANILQYLVDAHDDLKQRVDQEFGGSLPASQDLQVRAIRQIYADDFSAKFAQYQAELDEIYDKSYISIADQVAYVLTYRKEGFVKQSYDVLFEGQELTEERMYFQALAKEVEGTEYAQPISQEECSAAISEIAQSQLLELQTKGIQPTIIFENDQDVPVEQPPQKPQLIRQLEEAGIAISAELNQNIIDSPQLYSEAYECLTDLELVPVGEDDIYPSLMIQEPYKLQNIHQVLSNYGIASKENAMSLWDEADKLQLLQTIQGNGIQMAPLMAQDVLNNPQRYFEVCEHLAALELLPTNEDDIYVSLMFQEPHKLQNLYQVLSHYGIANRENAVSLWDEAQKFQTLHALLEQGIQMTSNEAQHIVSHPQVYQETRLAIDNIETMYEQHLLELKLKTNELIIKGALDSPSHAKYKQVKLAAETLIQRLEEAGQQFFTQPWIEREHFDVFNNTCKEAIQEAEGEFKNHRGLWYTIHPICRGILGVLASISVIPALVAHMTTKHGYKGTFFSTPKTDSLQKLMAFQDKLDSIKESVETDVLKPMN